MRRSDTSRGRGRGSSRATRTEAPVYSDHLRDLDLELDMLRLKREIIQQKQALLNRESQFTSERQNNFSEPSSSFNYYGPKQSQFSNSAADFSLLYNSSNGSRQNATKRSAQNWQDASSSKRSNNHMVINPWATPNNGQDSYQPVRKFTSHKSEQEKKAPFIKPLINPRDLPRPSRVTKPKAQAKPLPNKLQTYPRVEAKKLVSDTLVNVKSGSDILRPTVKPTLHMTGRMELALGLIIKEVKNKYSGNETVSTLLQSLDRYLKTIVRTRITDLMMNKHIGHFSTVINCYRVKYPEWSDEALINLAKDAKNSKSKENSAADENKKAIKEEVLNVLDNKLQEWFNDLLKGNNDKEKEILKHIDKLPNLVQPNEIAFDEDVIIINEEERIIEKKNDYTKVIAEIIDQQLPKLLPKYKFFIIKILIDRGIKSFLHRIFTDVTNSSQSNKDSAHANSSKQQDNAKNDFSQTTTTNKPIQKNPVTTPIEVANVEKVASQKLSAPVTSANATQSAPVMNVVATQSAPEKTVNATESTPENNVIATQSAPEKTVNATESAPENNVIATRSAPIKTESAPEKTSANAPHLSSGKAMLPYHVKLFGRPNIPSKAMIYEFLNKYNPATIKKHKSVNNLLVIGFTNKEDFDNIVAANESVVGDATLFIKASEKLGEAKDNEHTSEDKVTVPQNKVNSLKVENVSETEDGDNNANLNTKINYLLSTIREETENDAAHRKEEMQNEGASDPQDISDLNSTIREVTDNDAAQGKEEEQNEGASNLQDINNLQSTITEVTENDAAQGKKEDLSEGANDPQDITEGSASGIMKMNSDETNKLSDNIEGTIHEIVEITKSESELENVNEDSHKNIEGDVTENKEMNNKGNINSLKETGRATPTRTSSRLANATPSTIKTRRASKLTQ